MWRKLSKEAATEITKEVIRNIILWAVPPGIGLLGWIQNVPWFYVTVGVILSGAGVMTWLVQLDEWKSRNRVEHKLSLKGMKIHINQVNNQVVAVQFGFDLINTATFPNKFKVEDLKTHLVLDKNMRIYPPSKEYKNKCITISPGGTGFFFDNGIALPQSYQGPATVLLKCKLSYGKADRFDHNLEINKSSFINFLGPSISGAQHWYDQ